MHCEADCLSILVIPSSGKTEARLPASMSDRQASAFPARCRRRKDRFRPRNRTLIVFALTVSSWRNLSIEITGGNFCSPPKFKPKHYRQRV
jgi:hypothetical protein